MSDYYYSTQVFLAWCLNHYFYNGVHWTYTGKPFYTYRLPNPRSSNPFRVYEDIYEAWMDQDNFSGQIAQKRLSIRKGVESHSNQLPHGRLRRLKRICGAVDPVFFYPIVYRVDIQNIKPTTRLRVEGSGLVGSHEYLIEDLQPHEFEILFLDFDNDPDFVVLSSGNVSDIDALNILEGRCLP